MQHALRRDVLQWLLTLNLSFPIKNFKRDFSNGFLVAEVLSRYYPQHVQMHSFDYGTKLAKKWDNWNQLKKVFWKLDFHLFPDEIENIISCDRHDGASPFLEHLYGFLTHKRYKPEDSDVDDTWLRVSESSVAKLLFMNEVSTSIKEDCTFLTNGEKEVFLPTPVANYGFSSRSIELTEGTVAEFIHENSTLKNEGNSEEMRCSWDDDNAKPSEDIEHDHTQNTTRDSEQETSSEEEKGQLPRKRSSSNAVERARQKEKSRSKGRQRTSSPRKLVENGELAVDHSSRDAALAFRSPNRQRQFKTYTLADYRRQKTTGGYVMLGKLGPEVTESLVNQREKLEKMKQFGCTARGINESQITEQRKQKEKLPSSREKAMEFASKIPKPKRKVVKKEILQENIKPVGYPMTELEKLEAKHQIDRQQIEAMRKDLEIFIR